MKNLFDKIQFNQIKSLFELVQYSNDLDFEYIRNRYKEMSTNFDGVLKFLNSLGLIENKANQLISHFDLSLDLDNNDDILKGYIINILLSKENSFIEEIKDYLNNFKLIGDLYKYSPKTKDRISISGLRNFLIELGLIEYNIKNNYYVVSEKYTFLFLEMIKRNQISQRKLEYILNKKYELGLHAEYKILEYEKERLSFSENLINEIKHIALIDINAGYDILSWDKNEDNSNLIPRYIEVKAVTDNGYSFYWSRNEFGMAKEKKDRYFLYLLPVINNNLFNINRLKIIQDPSHILKSENTEWQKEVENFHIWKIN